MNPFRIFRLLKDIDERTRTILRLQQFGLDRDRLRLRGIELPAEAHKWWTGRWEFVERTLGELMSYEVTAADGTPMPLSETPLVQFLRTGDEAHLKRYMERHARNNGCLTMDSYDTHRQSLLALDRKLAGEPYDPAKLVIVLDVRNAILDGTHRASCLLARNRPDMRIKVLRILPKQTDA